MDVSPSSFDDPFFDDLMSSPDSLILRAAHEKAYHDLFYLLGAQTDPLGPYTARNLALEGLNCPIQIFQKILDYCPPVAEFANDTPPPSVFAAPSYSVVAQAALRDRPAHLDELLHRGASPNGDNADGSAPLAAAMEGQSTRCVRRLLREPELDLAPGEELLNAWAKLGLKDTEKLARCCRMVAPRLTGQEGKPLAFQGVPLPRQLTPSMALKRNNWALTGFLCRQGLSQEEGLRLLTQLGELIEDCLRLSLCRGAPRWRWRPVPSSGPTLLRRELAVMLDAIFAACPQLLRRRSAQTLLFFTVLAGKRTPPALQPWLERVNNRTVILDPSIGPNNLALILPFWEERLGERWIPTLDPRSMLDWEPLGKQLDLETFFSRCRILPFRPGKQLTWLSRLTLHMAPMPLLLRQLRPGGLLRREDPHALLAYCEMALRADRELTVCCGPFETLNLFYPMTRQRWQAALFSVKEVADYAL